MDRVHKDLLMEIYTKVNMRKESRTDMENITGLTVVILKEILRRDFVKVMVCGRKVRERVINIKESI